MSKKYISLGDLKEKFKSLTREQKSTFLCSYYADDEMDSMFEEFVENYSNEEAEELFNEFERINENTSNR